MKTEHIPRQVLFASPSVCAFMNLMYGKIIYSHFRWIFLQKPIILHHFQPIHEHRTFPTMSAFSRNNVCALVSSRNLIIQYHIQPIQERRTHPMTNDSFNTTCLCFYEYCSDWYFRKSKSSNIICKRFLVPNTPCNIMLEHHSVFCLVNEFTMAANY